MTLPVRKPTWFERRTQRARSDFRSVSRHSVELFEQRIVLTPQLMPRPIVLPLPGASNRLARLAVAPFAWPAFSLHVLDLSPASLALASLGHDQLSPRGEGGQFLRKKLA